VVFGNTFGNKGVVSLQTLVEPIYLAERTWLYVGPIAIDGLEVALKINNAYVPVHIDGIPPSPYAQNAKLTPMGVALPV